MRDLLTNQAPAPSRNRSLLSNAQSTDEKDQLFFGVQLKEGRPCGGKCRNSVIPSDLKIGEKRLFLAFQDCCSLATVSYQGREPGIRVESVELGIRSDAQIVRRAEAVLHRVIQ